MKTVVPVPTINANDDVVVIVQWHVADGARVEAGAPLVDVETTKAVSTVPADQAGWIRHRCRAGDEVAVGAELSWIFSTEGELSIGSEAPATPLAAAPVSGPAHSVEAPSRPTPAVASEALWAASTLTRFSPAAEKMAADLGLNLGALADRNLGLVTAPMLRAMIERAPAGAAALASDGLRRERIPAGKRAEIDALRQGAAESLVSSLTVQLDSRALRDSAGVSAHGLLPLVLAELAALLRANPKFTAFAEGEMIGYYDAVHLGVAVDLGAGIKVVVIRDADRLDPAGIAERLAELTLDYLEKKLGAEAVQGATFTVTDLTGLDVLHFQPLINGQQSAILGIGADSTQPHHPLTFTIAFDHRVLTGREVGELLQALRRRVRAGLPAPLGDCCDMCLTDAKSYYEELREEKYAVMLQFRRPDGSTGLICHRCQGGFV